MQMCTRRRNQILDWVRQFQFIRRFCPRIPFSQVPLPKFTELEKMNVWGDFGPRLTIGKRGQLVWVQ
jgi:hypothetical protein